MDNISIFQFAAPRSTRLEPASLAQLLLADSYELHPSFITKVQEHIFSGDERENPYAHLREFKQVCSCFHISGMLQDTLKWNLFPFSLTGIAKLWYTRNIESAQG